MLCVGLLVVNVTQMCVVRRVACGQCDLAGEDVRRNPHGCHEAPLAQVCRCPHNEEKNFKIISCYLLRNFMHYPLKNFMHES